MSYVVLARKWRPMGFDDLVGQDHVARTLANAIAADRVAHAFLFTGVRGVGKTTSARILAKALNCMRPEGTIPSGLDPGPTATPCLECSACREIALGNDLDVQEIDGASYNGVDEVRRLQDSLPYRPARDRYKIVIVDEVHMLSQSAWNAFLKTLEEPPAHVKFIFATTEAHKVPVTILSRVQRFDFKLITAKKIIGRLRYVLEQEGVEAEDPALTIIAREAAGSMRDAMSLLDQVIASGQGGLTEATVSQTLGVASRQILQHLAVSLLDGDPSECLSLVATIADEGFDIAHVARDILALLRDLVVVSVCKDPASLLDGPGEEREELAGVAQRAGADDLLRVHQGFSAGFDDVVRSAQPRAALEMLLVRLARRPPLLPLDQLVSRLVSLEKRLAGARPQGGSRGPGAGPTSAGGSARGAGVPRNQEPVRPREPNRRSSPSCEPRDAGQAAPAESQPAPAPAESQPAPAPAPAESQPAPPSRAARAESQPAPSAAPANARRLSEHTADWRRLLEHVARQDAQAAAVLEHAAVLELGPTRLVVGWEPDHPLAEAVSAKRSSEVLTAAAEATLGRSLTVEIRERATEARLQQSVAELKQREREAETRAAEAAVRDHPLIREATRLFGARVKEVRLPLT